MKYALWDTESNNLVASFDNQEEALVLVLLGIELNVPADVASLALEREDEQGEIVLIARGDALKQLANREL